ncbi:MAG TPA: Hsp20/alpha crystallin family protein [Pseudomonadales bacterium]
MNLLPRRSVFDIDRLLDAWLNPGESISDSGFFAPRIELKEKKNQYQVKAELPGVKKEDIHVTLDNGVLTIEAESRQEDKEEKDGKVIRQERRYGKFMRSFTVGSDVKEADIKAAFDDGVLTLSVPKSKEKDKTKKARRIAID